MKDIILIIIKDVILWHGKKNAFSFEHMQDFKRGVNYATIITFRYKKIYQK